MECVRQHRTGVKVSGGQGWGKYAEPQGGSFVAIMPVHVGSTSMVMNKCSEAIALAWLWQLGTLQD
jgi:hypothetical protein